MKKSTQKRGGGTVRNRARRLIRREGLQGPRRLTGEERKRAAAEQEAELRREFELRKKQQLAKAAYELDPVDTEILRLMLMHPMITHQEIADHLKIDRRQTIGERVNAPKFKRALEIANRSALEVFESHKARAVRKLAELIDSPNPQVSIRACIAFTWQEIHRASDHSSEDFVDFIVEAYDRAEANKLGTAAGSRAPE